MIGAIEEVLVTTVSSDGEGIGRDGSGRVVFIPGALPGEAVRAQVVAERPKSATGVLAEVLSVSPDRVVPPCPEVARGCGGCPWQHVEAGASRRLKEEIIANALRVAGVDAPAVGPSVELEPWGFRTTIRAAVVDGRAGFRGAASHAVVAVEGCLVAHPLLVDLLVDGRYDGADEVLLRCGARTGERLAAPSPAGVVCTVPADVRSDHLVEEAAGRRWRVSAGSFFQTRPDGVDALARLVLAAAGSAGGPETAVDLFSGVGLFAGVLAGAGWRVTAVENDPVAVADARVNVAGLPVRVLRCDVARWRPGPAGLVVADPNRRGLGRIGAEAVAATGAARVIVVSCDAIALGRDAAFLGRAGYRLTSVTPVDLFPHTPHVEVVSVFDA